MKKQCVIFFMFISFGLSAQNYSGFTIGLRSHTGGLTEFNNIIEHYNDTRPWLDNKLGKHRLQNGFELGLQIGNENMGINYFKYYRVWCRSTAKGTTPSGVEIKRKVRSRSAGIEIADVWYTPIHLKNVNIGIGVMPLGYARFRVHTKINDDDWVKTKLADLDKPDKEKWSSSSHSFSNLHIDVISKKLHAQLIYSRSWFIDDYDLLFLSYTINQGSAGGYYQRTKVKPSYWAFKIAYIL